jgi:hypothetical protein
MKEEERMRTGLAGIALAGVLAQGAAAGWTKLPSSFTRAYEGEIDGKLPVRLVLTKKGQQVTGSYVYTWVGKPLKLQGTINGEGAFTLEEFDPAGKKTGSFQGEFEAPTRLGGSWSGPNSAEPKHFYAYESFTQPTDANGPFTGSWSAGGPKEGPGFTLDLYQRGKRLEGLYHAITRNASRLDTDSLVEGTVKGNTATVRWTSGYSGVRGTAVLRLAGTRLSWSIPKPPTGEYWAPLKARLRKNRIP